MPDAIRLFLSAVSDEFGDYRKQLRSDLTSYNIDVKVQEDFKELGKLLLDKLDTYIMACDAVIHLIGDMTGQVALDPSVEAIRNRYPDLLEKLRPLKGALLSEISYTQWEAWLAIYHEKVLVIAKAADNAPRGSHYARTTQSLKSQQDHLQRLNSIERFPGFTFTSPDNLAKQLAFGTIIQLLGEFFYPSLTVRFTK